MYFNNADIETGFIGSKNIMVFAVSKNIVFAN